MNITKKVSLAGILTLIGMVAGIFSISPAIDATDYLTEAPKQANQVIGAAVFQLILTFTYTGFAILMYPIIKRFSPGFSFGFFSFRILAVGVSIVGTVLLLSTLTLSEVYVQNSSQNTLVFDVLGTVFKNTRDTINHVFMVVLLCAGNIMLYFVFIKAKLLPLWILIWGIVGSILSIIASAFIVFKVMEIITPEYLALNVPTALFEVLFGFWLLIKGLDKKAI